MRVRGTTMRHGALFALILASTNVYAQDDAMTPASYSSFTVVNAADGLGAALEVAENIYLPPGRYLLDNPLVIDRDRPLFLHGADRRHTILIGKNPGKPLFLVKRASVVGLTGLRLTGNANPQLVDEVAIRTTNAAPLRLEILDCTIDDAGLDFQGPGTIRIQGTSLFPHGRVTTSISLNHPDAIVTLVGGNISNTDSPVRIIASQASHVWQRRGLLRIYGTAFQATVGPSDIRIDTPSSQGPHVIAGVRSEGSNGSNSGRYPGQLLRVPASPFPVDVLVEGNVAAWGPLGLGKGTLVEYSAGGTLWLVGNDGINGVGALVGGDTRRSRVVAVGNIVFGGEPLAPPETGLAHLEANLFAYQQLIQRPEEPHTRFLPPKTMIASEIPPVPNLEIPAPLTRPILVAALPGMSNVRSFGALGDGIHDDTLALQKALDANCGAGPKLLFLPAGIYRTTDTLRFNHTRASCKQHEMGGWIAGEGSDRTIIRRDGTGDGGVFATQGMAFATIQGISFESRPYRASDPSPVAESTFSLEYRKGVGHATQAISFHDVRFHGGHAALAIGVESPEQCSENMLVDVAFEDAHMGLAVGAFNALSNIVYRARFTDNDITMGQPDSGLSGGTWMVFGATVRGTRDRELNLRNSAGGTWYFHGIDSDTPRLIATQGNGASFPILFEKSVLRPRVESPLTKFIDFGATGGPIFLHSSVTHLGPSRVGGGIASSYLVSIDSDLPDLAAVSVGENAIVSQTHSP